MKAATKTRSQRRMEKKQALLLLVLALVVSLASFTLGVVVGRQGAERDLAQKQQAAEKVLLTQIPARPVAGPSVSAAAATTAPVLPAKQDDLTFYENLGKEDTAPLGSGINLPPVVKAVEKPPVVPPIPLPELPIVKKTAPVVTVAKVAPVVPAAETPPVALNAPLPDSDPQGGYAVQVGSFAVAADAGALKQRLIDKGFSAFVVEADLGKKGLWYRVRLGPYADAAAAKLVMQVAEKKEKIKGFISRQ